MSTHQLLRDMLLDANDRIRELLRDRALLAMNMRTAAHTFDVMNFPLTAQALRDTVAEMEKRDASWMAEHDEESPRKCALSDHPAPHAGSARPEAGAQVQAASRMLD